MILRFYNMLIGSKFSRLNYRRFWQALNKGQSYGYYFDQGQPWHPNREGEGFEDWDGDIESEEHDWAYES